MSTGEIRFPMPGTLFGAPVTFDVAAEAPAVELLRQRARMVRIVMARCPRCAGLGYEHGCEPGTGDTVRIWMRDCRCVTYHDRGPV